MAEVTKGMSMAMYILVNFSMVRLMVKESIYGSKLVRYMMESGLKVSGMAMGIGRGLINMMPMHYVILI
jgi:hypothetical protein